MNESYKIIEEISLNAWPSLQQSQHDGWILRFAEGYTRRANSVNPLYDGSLNVEEKIKQCEQLYQEKQLRTVFKMSPFVHPADLDQRLALAGYRYDAPTSVQILDLNALQPQATQSRQQGSKPSAVWVENYVAMNKVSAQNIGSLKAILGQIENSTFVTLLEQNQPVACGLGVIEHNYVGLFDIVTDPTQRRRGFATQLIETILYWAKEQGATTAYLQVMLNNAPALKLYDKLGFKEVYQYWYRMKDNSPT